MQSCAGHEALRAPDEGGKKCTHEKRHPLIPFHVSYGIAAAADADTPPAAIQPPQLPPTAPEAEPACGDKSVLGKRPRAALYVVSEAGGVAEPVPEGGGGASGG